MKKTAFTITDLNDLPPSLNLEVAANLLSIGRTTAYAMARRKEFPVPVFQVGSCYRVPTPAVLRLLEAEVPTTTPSTESPDR